VNGELAQLIGVGEWALGDREREDRRIWLVRYTGRLLEGAPPVDAPSVEHATAELEAALRRAAAFARAGDEYLRRWTEVFDAALEGGALPDLPLLPASAPAEARRLAGMAAASWVFGGMGSWNDIGFGTDDPLRTEYDAVSADLYAAVLGGLAGAANGPA
jgi:hypothetical protein